MIGRKETSMSLLIWFVVKPPGLAFNIMNALNSFLYQGPEHEKTLGECTCKIANIPESA
uniref:Uncharacterized protein n=1 Tax=Anguilla anguilla TaxID=7936 RepID=A0A0E9PE95_ANGAN